MNEQTLANPWWAALITWGIVNLVNLLQSAGYLSRVFTKTIAINHALGYVMIAFGIPTGVALVAIIRVGADWHQWIGLAAYLVFLVLMIAVDYIWQVEFRSPRRTEILIPYLALFFGSILLMGLPMFRMDRHLWLVTVATTVLLLIAMMLAMAKGVG